MSKNNNQQIEVKADFLETYKNYKNVLKDAVQGQVVTRFPPEPSGYLHIGHVKASLLNYHYSQIYGGKMLLRFDDTNPTNEKDEFVQSIYDDLKTLGVQYDVVTHTSDHFDYLQQTMEKMIKEGLAYCDNTKAEQMKIERGEGIESKCRSQTVEENLKLFKEIVEGTEKGLTYCCRAKIDMLQKNKVMRDPVFYRCNLIPHHRTGTKYKAYPTYDFCCPVIDSLEGVTHALRTDEYHARNELYEWVQDSLKLRKVIIYDFSRLNLQYTCLSKRKLQWFVDTGRVEGWYDPRFPTVRGILRRGVQVETLVQFMLEQGPSKSVNLMEWDKLWALNNKIIDPMSPRYTAISQKKICSVHLINGPQEIQSVTVAQHAKNPQLGERILFQSQNIYLEYEDAMTLVEGEKITLMKWGNAFVRKIVKNQDESLQMDFELAVEDKDYKSTKKLGWLSKESPLTPVYLVEYDHLITVKKVEDDMDFESIVNNNSKFITEAYAEANVKNLQQGQVLQFERRGFFVLDKFVKNDKGQQQAEFILIPDGKIKSMSNLSSKVDASKAAGKDQNVKKDEKQEEKPLSKSQQKKLAEQQKKEKLLQQQQQQQQQQ